MADVPAVVLETDIYNHEPGHAAKHNAANAQVNALTDAWNMRDASAYATLQAAVTAMGYTATDLISDQETIVLAAPLSITKENLIDMTQANGANLDTLVSINLTQSVQTLFTRLNMFVKGNRYANAAVQTSPWNGGAQANTAPVVGYRLAKTKKAVTNLHLGAVNCDTGVLFEGDNEYTEAHIGTDYCGIGVHVTAPTNSLTSDELMLFVTGHESGIGFVADGGFKISGTVMFAVEQTLSYGAKITAGRWHLFGELRGIGKSSDGGFKLGPDTTSGFLEVDGILALVGGSDTNCAILADLDGGWVNGMSLDLSGQYKDGVRISGNVNNGSSAKIVMTNTPANPTNPFAVRFDGAQGFHLLPGSNIRCGGTALDFINGDNQTCEPSILTGQVHFDVNSGGNKVVIPRASFTNVTFLNERASEDNVVIFKGAFNIATLDAMPVKFRGMHAESVIEFARAPAYYDGKAWIAVGGLRRNPAGVTVGGVAVTNGFCGGAATILSAGTEVSIVHNLAANPPGRVVVTPTNAAAAAANWYLEYTSSNTVKIKVTGAAASDLTFDFAIRALT
jgi:hypothetical protein